MDINLVHAMHYQNEARYMAATAMFCVYTNSLSLAVMYQRMAAYNARKARCFMGLEE